MRTFTREARPGTYLRVVEPETVEQGDELEVVERPDHEVTIAKYFKAAMGERDLIPEILEAGVLDAEEEKFLLSRYGGS